MNANYSHHSDLFRALKGGANNFGIVTRIDFHTISQGPIVGGNIAHNITYIDSVLKAFADIAGAVEYDPYASLVMGLVYTSASKAWSLGTTAIYTKENLKPKVYDELRSIPTIKDTLNVTRLSVLSNESATPQMYALLSQGNLETIRWLIHKTVTGVSTRQHSQFPRIY